MAQSNNKEQRRSAMPRKNSQSFGDVTVMKQEVGDFTSGYFVMPSTSPSPIHDRAPKERKLKPSSPHGTRSRQTSPPSPHNTSRRDESDLAPSSPSTSPHKGGSRKNTTPKKILIRDSQKENRSDLLLLVAPSIKDSNLPKSASIEIPSRVSADIDDGYKRTSVSPPGSSRWAGPAFSNAPPPSALPMPSFDEAPLSSSLSPSQQLSPWETLLRVVPQNTPAAPSNPFQYGVPSSSTMAFYSAPSTMSLTEDLRRMLNISAGVPPMLRTTLVPA